ncbi:shTK domain protein [Oesophagostomum dentatum]|uniref:ShTK domain protein n=1 Tax=Oesophagostomum dentatum TaxID=61180 RepID=A0A0B1SBS8_OESDE|nr:shTK domain protein [Oesophagostomum dentatum]
MFVYFLAILLVLNAFTEEVVAQCADRAPDSTCNQMKNKGNCENPLTLEQMKLMCKKTCNLC